MTGFDVLTRAIALAHMELFDCPACACARAKTELDNECGTGVSASEALRQMAYGQVIETDEDEPLIEATNALRPYLNEIGQCPSMLTASRMMEILIGARRSLMN